MLKVIIPEYGIPESPIHWIKTYTDYHKQVPTVTPRYLDLCLLYRKRHGIDGTIGIQFNESICAYKPPRAEEARTALQTFPSKVGVQTQEQPIRLDGVELSKVGVVNIIILSQSWSFQKIGKLESVNDLSFKKIRSLRPIMHMAHFLPFHKF